MILSKNEPKRVFHHFEAISQIPRGSGNEKAVSDFIAAFAKELGLKYVQDASNNLVIYKPGTSGYEDSPPVILQGHLDMVCEKNEGTIHDFLKDPIKLYVNGDYLKARGTTLGADNGIAVAYCMTLLEADDISHPPLEVVLTTDEEAGMTGATNLDAELLNGRQMVNLDSGKVGLFTAGSAAAITAEYNLPIEWETPKGAVEACAITVKGLHGGHSGMDIAKERGNANRILGVLLDALCRAGDIRVANISGGMKVNAIPREAKALITITPTDKENLQAAFEKCAATLAMFFRVADPGLTVTLEPTAPIKKVMSRDCGQKLIASLLLLPCGVQTMSKDMDNLVAASCNIGVVETLADTVKITCMARGAYSEHNSHTEDKISALARITGAQTEFVDRSPAWPFNPDSKILKKFASYYEKHSGEAPKIEAVHAGLECGIFADKLPGLDIVAVGPNLYDLHTPEERLSISSTETIWTFLCGVLGEMK